MSIRASTYAVSASLDEVGDDHGDDDERRDASPAFDQRSEAISTEASGRRRTETHRPDEGRDSGRLR